MIEIYMPKEGMDMTEGRLIRWLKNEGDSVVLDEPIMEIETDKIVMEAESPGTGIFLKKLVDEDTVVPVLQVIGYIGQPGEAIPESVETAAPAAQKVKAAPAAVASNTLAPAAAADIKTTPYAKTIAKKEGLDISLASPSGSHGEIKAADVLNIKSTPLAARIAQSNGVELGSIQGSGHAGKIVKDDVLNALLNASPAREETRKPIEGARRIIGERMLKSHTEIPCVTQHMKTDVTKLLALRADMNAGRSKEDKISLNDIIIKITAKAVAEHPLARTVIENGEYVTKPDVNIGVAVGMDEGLLVPVIKHADIRPLSMISAKAKELADKARHGGIRPDDMKGGVFTVSNMGMFDVFAFTPIINQPESGILGVCSVEDELALIDGEISVKKIMMISLTFDHRIMDGIGAVKFQLRIKELLENPIQALL